ncbi:hypothetical protein BASA83_000696 [Batrachochytrium salamandrivorans]|nr:hypothetical protein BASA83_000696 [Batrachochytrium salamandrivorans]
MDSAKSIGLTALYSFPERHGKVSKAMSMPDFQIDRVDGCGPSSTLCTNHSNNTISTAGATATKNKISVHSSSAPSLRSSKQGRCINLPIIKSRDSQSLTVLGVPSPITRILIAIAQILDGIEMSAGNVSNSDLYQKHPARSVQCNEYEKSAHQRRNTFMEGFINSTCDTPCDTLTASISELEISSAPNRYGLLTNSINISPQDPKESIIPDSSIPESALILHPDTTPCINEAEYMSMSNSEETALPQAHQNTPLLNDLKRKVIRQCFDLKRLINKEGPIISADSQIQKSLFSKSSHNISILFRCLQNTPDIDLSTVISHLLIRLVTTCECNQSNIYAMVKKNLVSAVMRCLQFYYKEYLVANPTPDLPNLSNRLDDVLSSMLTLLLRLAKFEIVPAFIQYKTIISISEKLLKSPPPQINQAKLDCVVDLLALYAKQRLLCNDILGIFDIKFFISLSNSPHEGIQRASLRFLLSTIEHDFGKRMFESSDGVRILTDLLYTALHTSDGANAAISSTNSIPALLVAVLRTSLSRSDLPFLERIRVREFPLLSDQAITTGLNKTDCTGAADIDKSSNPIFNSSDPGEANSKPRLSECLDNTIASENTPSKALKEPSVKVKSITNPSILITYGDYLKMMDDHISRVRNPSLSENGKEKLCTASHTFSANSLKELSLTRQNSNEPNLETPKHFSGKQVKDDNVSNKDSDAVRSHVDQQLQSLVDRLNRFCPELLPLKHQLASANEPLVPNIRVRHVQPMALGKHIVCRSICPVDPELQIRKSPLGLRRAAFEHTEKMLKMTPKGTLVYDVMQDQIALDALALNDSTLHFDSRFESGNLQMAIKTSQFEYDLMVQSDINTQQGKHNQWFYFSVKQMVPNIPYKFNILNLKITIGNHHTHQQLSIYPLLPNHLHIPHLYFRSYLKPPMILALFRITTRTRIRNCKDHFTGFTRTHSIVRIAVVHLFAKLWVEMNVHPGESNSSYIMNGLIQFLLSEDSTAVSLRRKCIFKIVPMLNPDGVVNGSHRCSLSGLDLNRQWKNPSKVTTPTIFWTKLLWGYLVRLGNQPLLVCDFHGHSRRKNAFVYGCENGPGDAEGLEKIFPLALAAASPFFEHRACRYAVERSKESTSRIVMWREFGIINSFTLESSYCGADFGERKGTQFSISDLERMGADFCRGLLALTQEPKFNGREMLLSSPIPPVVAQFGSGDTKCASGKYTNDCVNVHGADVAVESFNDISRPKCTTQSTSTVVSTSSRLCKTSSGSASAVKGSKKKGQGRGFNTSTPPRPAPSSSKESTLSEGTSKLRSRSPKKKHSTGSRSSLRTTQSSQASPLTEIKKSRKGTKQNSTDRLATNACENLSGEQESEDTNSDG